MWLIGPLPIILTNATFIKLHHFFVVSYAAGWLVKLVIVAIMVERFAPVTPRTKMIKTQGLARGITFV